jgi:hypothetical protein
MGTVTNINANKQTSGYKGNANLVKAGYIHPFTQEQLDELIKCKNDVVYFAKNYIKIVNVDRGLINFELWPYQEQLLNHFTDNRFVICKFPRQTGKTSCVVAWLLHYILFNKNANVAILANKGSTAREILSRLQLAYEWLPKWLQQGATVWNKGNIELANGSKVLSAATSSSAVRGYSFNIIFFDEFAFIPNNVAEEFFTSVYPTISSGKKTKVFIVSTPNGMNKFYKMWTDAKNRESDYFPVEVNWWDVPGRDEKWKEQTIRNTSKRQWSQEFECAFLGSSNTLIDGDVLARLAWEKPIDASADETLAIWERPREGRTYVLSVDVAHGQGLDYSTFQVIDVTNIPYVQVARYRSNLISPMVLPTLIARIGTEYNEAYVLLEINDIGSQVADVLHHELGYENLIKTQKKQNAQQQVSGGFGGGKKTQLGIKTSTSTKRIGCANIKTLIEQNKLIIKDYETVKELTTFVTASQSFAAEPGTHDDLAMALVQFGWLAAQRHFRETSSQSMDIRAMLEREHMENDDAEQLFFGIYDDGQAFIDNSTAGALPFVNPSETDNNLDTYSLKEVTDKIPEEGQGVPERLHKKDILKGMPADTNIQEIIKRSLPNFMGDSITYLPDKLSWPDAPSQKTRKFFEI